MRKYNLSKSYRPEVLQKLHNVQLQILKDFSEVCDKYNIPYFAVYGTALGAVRHGGFIPWDDDVDVAMLREDYNRFFSIFTNELGERYNLLTPDIDDRYACTVTHLQKKGTKFISEMSKDLKCEQCIDIDIFPLDFVAMNEKEERKQARKATFFGKLLFLCGTPYPVIPVSGIAGYAMSVICIAVHFILKILRISPRVLYRKYLDVVTSYNDLKGVYVTSFEYTGCIKDKIRATEIFPLKKVKFENIEINIPNNNHEFLTKVYGNYMKLPPENERVNHMPVLIQFEGEEPLYE